MPLADLNASDRTVILECLRAAATGPFFPSWEFHTLFGLERREWQEISDNWPEIDDTEERVYAAIGNSMNWLLFYPIDEEHLWSQYVSVSRAEVGRIFAVWRGGAPSSPIDGIR